jgi:hypothetical protein
MNRFLKYTLLSLFFIGSASYLGAAKGPSEDDIKKHDQEIEKLQVALLNKINKKEETTVKALKKDKKNLVSQETYEVASNSTIGAFETIRKTVKYETNALFHKKPLLNLSGIF